MARLRSIMWLLQDVPRTARFFKEGLGLPVEEIMDGRFAEVPLVPGGTSLSLKTADSCAASTTGYSPFLHFDVDDMDTTIVRCLSLGATLDGPIKYPAHGKTVSSARPPKDGGRGGGVSSNSRLSRLRDGRRDMGRGTRMRGFQQKQ